jgi:sensor histidine kinase regulating citrate/malate metabolism
MQSELEKVAHGWIISQPDKLDNREDYYCQTRDNFQARLDKMMRDPAISSKIGENELYILSAITGEIGSNSFDHNLGNWPNIPGIFFSYEFSGDQLVIVLADRGRGVLKTLKRVRPEIPNDRVALEIAFTEKLSGRAPENRGNGLKFVREEVKTQGTHLVFSSGKAVATLNQSLEVKDSEENIQGTQAIINFRCA